MAVLRYDIIGNNLSLNQAVNQSVSSLNNLNSAAEKSNQAIRNQIIPIKELQKELQSLNRQKLNVADAGQLSTINRRISELTAEITRFQRAGTQGFDQFGSAISGAESGIANLGQGLTKGLGIVRQLAYIIPGLGVAGIFNLAFEAITAASVSLDLFNTKAKKSKEELKEIQRAEDEQYGKTGFINAAANLAELTEKVRLAKNGFLDKKQVLEEYNSTLGLTVGKVNSLGEAEQKIIDKGPAYLQFLLLKAKAEYAFKQAAEASYQIDVQNDKIAASKGVITTNPAKFFGPNRILPIEPIDTKNQILSVEQLRQKYESSSKPIADNLQKINVAQRNLGLASQIAAQKQVESLTKVQTQAQKVAAQTQKQLEDFAKDNGFNVFAFKDTKTQDGGVGANPYDAIFNSLTEIANKTKALSSESGLKGYALEVQKITDKYISLNHELDVQQQKLDTANKRKNISPADKTKAANDQNLLDTDRAGLSIAKQKELADARINESKRVSDEIQRINNEFGVKAEQSRAKELLQITAKYDAEVAKAKGNVEILKALDQGRLTAIQAINDKYAAIEQDLQDKIFAINAQASADIAGKEESDTQKIQNEWDKRKDAASKYYDELRRLAASAPAITGNARIDNIVKGFNIGTLNANQSETNAKIDTAASTDITRKILEPFTSGLNRSVRQFGDDFYNTITSVDTYAKGTFESIFSDLTSKLTASLNKVFFEVILNGLSRALSKAISSGTSGLVNSSGKLTALGAGIAGAGIAGGVLSASTPKTSTVGQGAGGALSGAATGAAIGSVIPGLGTVAGGIIGGTIGLLGGIFGASKAQKELQAQQLAEQKQQTDILKASLAYTSQIIGRDTANGIVTGITVGSFGQLIATVSGKDLQFVLDRNKNGR